jgi:hypothetical protein
MGFGSNFADVIEQDKVKELCPVEFDAFLLALRADEILNDEDDFEMDSEGDEGRLNYAAQWFFCIGEETTLTEGTQAAWAALQAKFTEATGGLELGLGFHGEDEGDRYDEIVGVFWTVGGMYQLTPAGERFKGVVERKFFVTFG